MRIVQELLAGCYLLKTETHEDRRGSFTKTYQAEIFSNLGIEFHIQEEFYSISNKNVLRGMHFQRPPFDHDKLVYCMSGSVLDVVLDLRRGLNYSHVACAQLSAHDGKIIFIPKGVAHGFLASVDASTLVYKTSTIHQPQYDDGIAWNSFDFNWGLVDAPIISMRDESHPSLEKFDTPF